MQIRYFGEEKFEIKTGDVTVSLSDNVSIGDFVLPGAGEYEKGGVFIEGIPDDGSTIYIINAEDMRLCYLGKVSHELKEAETKEIGAVDILFVPFGGDGSCDLKLSLENISKIDPRIVIPMLYSDLADFKKCEGVIEEDIEVLKIKKADLPDDERRNIILNKIDKK